MIRTSFLSPTEDSLRKDRPPGPTTGNRWGGVFVRWKDVKRRCSPRNVADVVVVFFSFSK